MVTDHREGFFFQYMIQILHILWVSGIIREVGDFNTCLIMAPREHDVFETAMRLVDPILCRIDPIVRIRIRVKGLGVYDLV